MKNYNLLNLFFVIVLSYTIFGCDFSDSPVEKIKIPISQRVTEFSDGSFLSFAHGIDIDDRLCYIADANNKRIVLVDTQFSFIRSIGNSGRGPGEFVHVTHLKTFQNYIYAYDFALKRISVFSKFGEYVKTIIPKFCPELLTPAILDEAGRFLLSTSSNSKPIVVLSDSGTLIKEFGEQLPDYDGKIYPLRNNRFVFSTGDCIIALCTSLPFVEKYDREGKLLMRKDLSLEYAEIRRKIKNSEKRYRELDDENKGRTAYNLFTGADLKGNFLYAALSVIKEINGEEADVREILQIDVRELKIKKVIVPVNSENENISFMCIAKSDNAFYLGTDEIYKLYYEE